MTEKIVKVSSIGLGKLNNAEYLRLMTRISGQIKQIGASKLALPQDKVDEFDQKLLVLNDVFAQNRASAETTSLQELDKQRDYQWSYLLQRIQIASSSPLEKDKKASSILSPEIKPYIGKQAAPVEQETQLIFGFLHDMQKSENFVQIQALGLLPALENLEDLNNRYASLADERTINKQTQKLPDSNSLRKEIDPIYDYLTNRAFAENLSNGTDETLQFLLALNSFIDAANTAYKQRTGQVAQKEETDKS